MISSLLQYLFIYLLGVLLSSAAQILLKKEAVMEHKSIAREYLNFRVILAYGIIFGVTLLTIMAYHGGLPVSWGNVLESSGYIFVTIFGVVILKEKISKQKIAALCVILTGVVLFALG